MSMVIAARAADLADTFGGMTSICPMPRKEAGSIQGVENIIQKQGKRCDPILAGTLR